MHFRILKKITVSGFLTALECTEFVFGWGSGEQRRGKCHKVGGANWQEDWVM